MNLFQRLEAGESDSCQELRLLMNSESLLELQQADAVIERYLGNLHGDPITTEENRSFQIRLCIASVKENPQEPECLSRYEAAHFLVRLAEECEVDGAYSDLKQLVEVVTETFLNGDDDVRTAIETGFLEHAFEHAPLVPYFSHWKDEPELNAAHVLAIEWANAHPRNKYQL